MQILRTHTGTHTSTVIQYSTVNTLPVPVHVGTSNTSILTFQNIAIQKIVLHLYMPHSLNY